MGTRVLYRRDSARNPLVVEQTGTLRELHFDNGIIQSRIDLQDSSRLPLAANRAMLAHLAFGQRPRSVLLAGCGGGAIARWFASHAPHIRGTAVELDPQVARLARQYFEFPTTWQLMVGDARRHLAKTAPASYDFILVDIENAGHTPDWVGSLDFLADCRGALTTAGVVTFNLVAENRDGFLAKLAAIRQVFEQRTICLAVPDHDNVLVLAFRRRPSLRDLTAQVARRSHRWGLDLTQFVDLMQRTNPSGSGIL